MRQLGALLLGVSVVIAGCAQPMWRWSHPAHVDQGRFNVDLMQCQQYAAATAPYSQRYGQYDFTTALLLGSRQAAYEAETANCMGRLGYSFARVDAPPSPSTSSPSAKLAPNDTNFGPAMTLAPVTVESLSVIAGRWQGKFVSGTGEGAAVMTIDRDGNYTAVVTARRTETFTGRIELIDGALRGTGDRTKRVGTFSFYNQGDVRTLKYRSDDGTVRAELVPIR